ncbi:VWA domain-containing protein [Streptomyces sp. TM32]|uniref:VWA domain-containing protein n=1 Tax=Streptomyces sp. TM32 TaxID=1652669 RepID=UPI0010136C64|nr:vWA domain-containing protein [Streptomyces sp. TM32]RXS84876.1 VWA domain-containing protein [Streptomyces sp. TM32]
MVLVGDMTPLGLSFDIEMDATWDLAFDDEQVDALLTIRASPAADAPSPTPIAEILIMDRSLSMAGLGKLSEAKRAMCAAIDTLQDGTYLGIIAGHHEAEVIYPDTGGLARVDAAAKAAAKRRVMGQLPGGGTAIGTWLTRAKELFDALPARDTVRHALLYTDGKDEYESAEKLDSALAECTDQFVCDARGLGNDWNYTELLRITQALHGKAEAVVTISDLTRDFTHLIEEDHSIVVPRVYLGLLLGERFRLGFVRQTVPVEADLTTQQQPHDDEIHIPLGAWAAEKRQYHLSLRFDPDKLPLDEQLSAARITVRAECPDATRTPCAAPKDLRVRRLATRDFPVRPPESLTQVENLRELGMAMRACADAQQSGRYEEADRELRLALELSQALGDTERLELLRAVSTTGPDGRTQVRRDASRGHIQQLGLRSTRTAARGIDPFSPVPNGGPVQHRCPRCKATTTAREPQYCEECGHAFDSVAAPAAPDDPHDESPGDTPVNAS